jgi:redox-sensitive bicupin YhaK (pirin superfamily)
MKQYRTVKKIQRGKEVFDGAGVKLNRIFGFYEKGIFDPFLLLDRFGSDKPDEYTKGFPWHPHRGMETITYMLAGSVEHGDSLQNNGKLYAGDLQWMNAGSGIIHQEMPIPGDDGRMYGLQLWVNLPRDSKMIPPNYQEIRAKDIPSIKMTNGTEVKVIAGMLNDIVGPIKDVHIKPSYFDCTLPAHENLQFNLELGHTALVVVYSGNVKIGAEIISDGDCAILNDGNVVSIDSLDQLAKFLIISGRPINEPIAWGGPIVMNTKAELDLAFEELDKGTFIKTT